MATTVYTSCTGDLEWVPLVKVVRSVRSDDLVSVTHGAVSVELSCWERRAGRVPGRGGENWAPLGLYAQITSATFWFRYGIYFPWLSHYPMLMW